MSKAQQETEKPKHVEEDSSSPSSATAAASSSSTPPPASEKRPSEGGRLYACGRSMIKGTGICLPLNKSDVDSQGHCPFPKPLAIDKHVKFSKVRGEQNTFCAALEASPQQGALWCWTHHCAAAAGAPRRVIDGDVVSFDCGDGYCVAALKDGSLMIVGSNRHLDSTSTDALTSLRKFKVQPPKPVSFVSAGNDNITVICQGEVYTIGHEIVNGFDHASLDKWLHLPLASTGHPIILNDENNGKNTPKVETETSTASTPKLHSATFVNQGGMNGVAISSDGLVFIWGDGISGTLGVGSRVVHHPSGCPVAHKFPSPAVHAAATNAQAFPLGKRIVKHKTQCDPGQEGPRLHVCLADGSLWIAGTTHKGLACNLLYKDLSPERDNLTFEKVGGHALDHNKKTSLSYTGGAEMLFATAIKTPTNIALKRLGMAAKEEFGKDGNTNYLNEQGLKIVSSQPAHIHSIYVAEDGRVFGGGCGSDGRTGLDCFIDPFKHQKRLMKCYISSPTTNETLENKKVLDACACRNFTLFVVE